MIFKNRKLKIGIICLTLLGWCTGCDGTPGGKEQSRHELLQVKINAEQAHRNTLLLRAAALSEEVADYQLGNLTETAEIQGSLQTLKAAYETALSTSRERVVKAQETLEAAELVEREFQYVPLHQRQARCGDDGCSGSCGSCGVGALCFERWCRCIPECGSNQCGPDGCGGLCGDCGDQICNAEMRCEPPPEQKAGKEPECTPNCTTDEMEQGAPQPVLSRNQGSQFSATPGAVERKFENVDELKSYIEALDTRLKVNGELSGSIETKKKEIDAYREEIKEQEGRLFTLEEEALVAAAAKLGAEKSAAKIRKELQYRLEGIRGHNEDELLRGTQESLDAAIRVLESAMTQEKNRLEKLLVEQAHDEKLKVALGAAKEAASQLDAAYKPPDLMSANDKLEQRQKIRKELNAALLGLKTVMGGMNGVFAEARSAARSSEIGPLQERVALQEKAYSTLGAELEAINQEREQIKGQLVGLDDDELQGERKTELEKGLAVLEGAREEKRALYRNQEKVLAQSREALNMRKLAQERGNDQIVGLDTNLGVLSEQTDRVGHSVSLWEQFQVQVLRAQTGFKATDQAHNRTLIEQFAKGIEGCEKRLNERGNLIAASQREIDAVQQVVQAKMDQANLLAKKAVKLSGDLMGEEATVLVGRVAEESDRAFEQVQANWERIGALVADTRKVQDQARKSLAKAKTELARLEKQVLAAEANSKTLGSTKMRLGLIHVAWTAAHAQLRGAEAAREAAQAGLDRVLAETDEELLPEIRATEARVEKLLAKAFPSDLIPEWSATHRITCGSDQRPLAEAPYCALPRYGRTVLALLARRERGWAELSLELRLDQPEWRNQIVILDNLHRVLKALDEANARWFGLNRELEQEREGGLF